MESMEMTIDSIRVSPMNNQRVVILKEKGRDRYLPIWIGPAEADAIAMKLKGGSPVRPHTYDLACAAIDALGGSIDSVVIHRLENDTFYARMIIKAKEGRRELDCRPSDGMAMAVRAGASILADEEVLNRAGVALESLTESSETTPDEMSDGNPGHSWQCISIYRVDCSGPHLIAGKSIGMGTLPWITARSHASGYAQRTGRAHRLKRGWCTGQQL